METPQARQGWGAPCAAPSLPTFRTRLGDRVPSAPRSCPRHTRRAPRLLRSRASSAGERRNDQTNLALSSRDKSREAALNSCHEALQNKRATEASCRERCPRCPGRAGRSGAAAAAPAPLPAAPGATRRAGGSTRAGPGPSVLNAARSGGRSRSGRSAPGPVPPPARRARPGAHHGEAGEQRGGAAGGFQLGSAQVELPPGQRLHRVLVQAHGLGAEERSGARRSGAGGRWRLFPAQRARPR